MAPRKDSQWAWDIQPLHMKQYQQPRKLLISASKENFYQQWFFLKHVFPDYLKKACAASSLSVMFMQFTNTIRLLLKLHTEIMDFNMSYTSIQAHENNFKINFEHQYPHFLMTGCLKSCSKQLKDIPLAMNTNGHQRLDFFPLQLSSIFLKVIAIMLW